jgi:hypothetical protein
MGDRVVRSRVLYGSRENHPRMGLQTLSSVSRKGVSILEASHEKKAEFWESITEL